MADKTKAAAKTLSGNPTEQELREVEEDCLRLGFEIPAPRPFGTEPEPTTAIYAPSIKQQIRQMEQRICQQEAANGNRNEVH